jgi:uncharacterized protein (DUF1697 family)
LEARIAKHLEGALGYRVDTFVRRTEDVARIGATRVFPEDGQTGITIHVGFLSEELSREIAGRLAAIRTDQDEFQVIGGEYYWLCRGRITESKVWALPEMKALRFPSSTMRNITSVRKLIAKHLT